MSKNLQPQQRILMLGASRGLGRAVATALADTFSREQINLSLTLVSRREPSLVEATLKLSDRREYFSCSYIVCDLSKPSEIEQLCPRLAQYDRIFYFAGGGPHGLYASKPWHSHEWAMQVCLLTPMRLIYEFLKQNANAPKQFIAVGSAIAENHPDPGAASYSAAKHGLLGVFRTLTAELSAQTDLDLRLFSPGYLDTDLIPQTAKEKLTSASLHSPQDAAASFVQWCLDPSGQKLYNWPISPNSRP